MSPFGAGYRVDDRRGTGAARVVPTVGDQAVGRFAALMERWRQSLGLSNRTFARHARARRSRSGRMVQRGRPPGHPSDRPARPGDEPRSRGARRSSGPWWTTWRGRTRHATTHNNRRLTLPGVSLLNLLAKGEPSMSIVAREHVPGHLHRAPGGGPPGGVLRQRARALPLHGGLPGGAAHPPPPGGGGAPGGGPGEPPAADAVPIPAGLHTVDSLLAAADRLPEGARWQLVQRLLDRLRGAGR